MCWERPRTIFFSRVQRKYFSTKRRQLLRRWWWRRQRESTSWDRLLREYRRFLLICFSIFNIWFGIYSMLIAESLRLPTRTPRPSYLESVLHVSSSSNIRIRWCLMWLSSAGVRRRPFKDEDVSVSNRPRAFLDFHRHISTFLLRNRIKVHKGFLHLQVKYNCVLTTHISYRALQLILVTRRLYYLGWILT